MSSPASQNTSSVRRGSLVMEKALGDGRLSKDADGSCMVGNLRFGRTSDAVVGRIIRMWDSRNVKKNGEFMGITFLLLDKMDCVIHGFVPANRASYYRDDLVEGSVVRLDRFEVARSAHTYKITENKYMIRFITSTRVCEVLDKGSGIKIGKFMVRGYTHLQGLANTNLELPDVVGQIMYVQGSDLKNNGVSSRILVKLTIDANTTVYLSLWDEAASTFRGYLAEVNKLKVAMLVTTVNPKLFGGNMYLNSTGGTRFYFDKKLPEIADFLNRIEVGTTDDFTCIDTLRGVNKKEVVSIGELNQYISNSTEQCQEADFLCKARIVGAIDENGWCFVSCTGCNKKVERNGNSFSCARCGDENVTGVVRFRVEYAVDDGTESATFVIFDKEISKLTNQDASVLALEKGGNGEVDVFPECLNEFNGKEFVFQIRVTPFNFTASHRTFTVSTIIEETACEEDLKDKSLSEKAERLDYGQGVEVDGKGDIPSTSSGANAKYTRKRRRE